jgi:hypothetical protein
MDVMRLEAFMRIRVRHFVKRLFVALIAFIVVCECMPVQKVEAKRINSYKTVQLKQKTWGVFQYNNIINDSYKYKMIKINVPANGYVKLETKKQGSTVIEIYHKSRLKKNDDIYPDTNLYDHKTYYRLLKKGDNFLTVGLYLSDATSKSTNIKIRWTFIKASNPSNSCRAKAKKIASSKKETIVFNDGYEYSRWYKIVLKKRQPITVNLKCLDDGGSSSEDFDVYNSSGESIHCPPLVDYKTYRTTILPKGTYYINIKHDPWETGNRIMNFSWK